MSITYLACCGIKEFAGIGNHSSPQKALLGLQETLTHNGVGKTMGAAFFIFSQAGCADGKGYGDKLKAYIEEQNLGEVCVVGQRRNPNSGRQVKMFVWMPDAKAFEKWTKENTQPVKLST